MQHGGPPNYRCTQTHTIIVLFFILNCICFTSYFVFCIAVLPQSPGVVYYHLLLRRETSIPGVAPFSFSNRNLGSFCA